MDKILNQLPHAYGEIYPHLLKQISDMIILVSVEDNQCFRYVLANEKALDLLGW